MLFPYSWAPWFIRKLIKSGTTLQKVFMRPEKVFSVTNQEIPVDYEAPTGRSQASLPIRVYTPEGEGPFPIVIFYHGGGWVLCGLETHDHICRHIANKANCVVISVEYRLAPEFKFPTAPEDAYAAALYIHAHAAEFKGDPNRICLSGDSAGGNLSIVCSHLTKDRNGPKFQCLALIYPSTDLRDHHYPSYDGKNIGLNAEDGRWFLNHYIPSQEQKLDPRASPIVREDLTNLPPTLVIIGEHDRLKGPAEAYAQRLEAAGVPVIVKGYDAVGHGFLSIGAPEVAVQALDYMSDWIKQQFTI